MFINILLYVFNDRLLMKFVIGNRACEWHASDLMNEYSCEKWNVVVPSDGEIMVVREGRIPKPNQPIDGQPSRIYGLQSLSFTVR